MIEQELILPGLPGGRFLDGSNIRTQPSILVVSEQSDLSSEERGVVLSSPFRREKMVSNRTGDLEIVERDSHCVRPDAREVRQALLFWDKIHMPESLFPYFAQDEEYEILRREGIFRSRRIFYQGHWATADLVTKARLALFRDLEEGSPGRWSMSRSEVAPSLPHEETEAGRGLLVQLTDCLPVPNADTPFDELLNFRIKRKPERLDLRYHLEGLYQKIQSAPDRPLAEVTEFEALRRNSAEYLSCIKEAGIRGSLISFGAEMEFNVLGAGTATVAALTAGISFLPALAGGLATSIAVNLGKSLKKRSQSSSPFEYVAKYQTELPWINS